jgi:hypothetical protein
MDLILRPSIFGHRLGWVRVVCAVVAAHHGEGRLTGLLTRWVVSRRDAGEDIQTTRLSGAVQLARELCFIDSDSRLTDHGRVLVGVDDDALLASATPFDLPLKVRWLLWFAMGRADGAFWRSAFQAWSDDGQNELQWLERIIAHDHDLKPLRDLIERSSPAQVQRAQVHARFSRVRALGWSDRLPALHAWALAAPDEWTGAELLEAFAVAEQLGVRDPQRARLNRLLHRMPDRFLSIAGPGRKAAPLSAIQHLLVAEALDEGYAERWFGAPLDAVLQAETARVRLEAGATRDDPNVTWPDFGMVEQDSPAVPPPSPPVTPALSEPPSRVRVVQRLPEEDVRARAWLRYVAWWLRGPTPTSVLQGHHLSRVHLVETIARWAKEESAWWRQRVQAIAGVVPASVLEYVCSPSRVAAELAACVGSIGCAHVHAMVTRVAQEDPRPHCLGVIRAWLGTGDPDWRDVERATADLFGHLVDTHQHTVEELRLRVRDQRSEPVAAANAVLAWVTATPDLRRLRLECDLLIRPPSFTVPEQVGRADLAVIGEEVVGHRHVRAIVERETAEPALVAMGRLHHDVVSALVQEGARVRVPVVCSPLDLDCARAMAGENPEDLLRPAPQHASEEGWAFWGRGDWFQPRPPTPRPETFRPASANEPRIADRLMHLWLGIEHAVGAEDRGADAIAPLAQAAVAAWGSAAVDDALEAAGLAGMALARPSGWDAFGDEWSRPVECQFVQARLEDAVAAIRMGQSNQKKNEEQKRQKLVDRLKVHAVWAFRAVYDVRNRVVHQGWHDPFEERASLNRVWENAAVIWSWLEGIRGGEGWDTLERPYVLSLEGKQRSEFDAWRRRP